MKPPIFHPRTKKAIEVFLLSPSHGLLLIGEPGSGKQYLAEWLADQASKRVHILEKPKDKSTISIEQIRELYNLTRSGGNVSVIIKNSHLMGLEAQNAFLKLLEEPPEGAQFILTTANPNTLLPTIRSRTQHVSVLKPQLSSLIEYAQANSSLSDKATDALLVTSNRRIGQLSNLLQDPQALSEHLERVSEAKKYYGLSAYERHIMCIFHNYEKVWIRSLLEMLTIIVQALIRRSIDSLPAMKKLIQQMELIEQTSYRTLKMNGNPKIHLTRLSEKL